MRATHSRRDVLIATNAIAGVDARALARILELVTVHPAALDVDARDVARRAGLADEVAGELARRLGEGFAAREAERVGALGGWILVRGELGYPDALETIADAPTVLYGRGTLPETACAAIAIVGARRASRYGLAQAERFAYLLGALGAVVVSGLARGIDAAAHTGCLEAGGSTVAVLGSGLDVVYPREHGALARRIAEHGGAVVSEFPLGTPPLPWHFPRRNRIIAGLAAGVVVVEAAAKSGSLVTARLALDAGREVMAMPGPIDAPGSAGPHQLIRDGAILVGGIDDVVAAVPALVAQLARASRGASDVSSEQRPQGNGPGAGGVQESGRAGVPGDVTSDSDGTHDATRDEPLAPNGRGPDPERARVLAALSDEPVPLDAVAHATRLPLPRVMALLCLMSLAGLVVEHPGQRYSRTRWAA